MGNFKGTRLKDDLTISKLYTVHYFEYSKTYRFTGEKHNFWEIVYVDKGNAKIETENRFFTLRQGEMAFHKPDEWHNIYSDGNAPNIVIFSFDTNCAAMDYFKDKVLSVSQEQKTIISKIINEYANAFSTPLNDPFTSFLIRKKAPIGSEQLLRQYLSELLILFLRESSSKQQTLVNINNSNLTLNKLLAYMQKHINEKLTINDLTSYCGFNKTTISQIFKKSLDMAPIEYFIYLKTEEAKRLLREDNLNVTQIADHLGYTSVHYFSRQFKKVEGMSPIEYSNSVKAMLGGD